MARLGVNLASDAISWRYVPYIRWDRCTLIDEGTGGFGNRLTVSGTDYGGIQLFSQGYVDANYELKDPLPPGASAYQRLFFSKTGGAAPPSLAGVNMKVTWDGGAAISSITFGGDADNDVVVNLGSKFATFTFGATGGSTTNSWIVFNFSGTSDPPTNIRLFEAANETALTNGVVLDPNWLDNVGQWKVLRLMDFMHINGSEAIDYADLAGDDFVSYTQNKISSGRKVGPPVSVIAAIASQTNRPIWVCIPHKFTDDAIESLATYLRDNVTQPVYVEYSNETWNGGFSQSAYCETQGALISAWSGDSSSVQGLKWSGLRAAQVSSIFRNVYGEDSGTNWIGVMGTQLANSGVLTFKLVGLDYFLDPGNSLKRSGDTSATLFGHAAGAPYFGPSPSTANSGIGATLKPYVDAADPAPFYQLMYDNIRASAASNSSWLNIAFWRSAWQTMISDAESRGWTGAMYEGGYGSLALQPLQDNNSGETDGAAFNTAFMNFALTQQCADLHVEMYNLFLSDGGVLPNKYDAISQHSKFGSWGMQQQSVDDNNLVYTSLAAWNAPAALRSIEIHGPTFRGH